MNIAGADLIDRSSLERTAEGIRIVRGFLIANVGGYFAAATQCPGLPQVGDPDRTLPICTCKRHFIVPAKATDQVYVDVSFESPRTTTGASEGKWVLNFGGSLIQNETQVDFERKPLLTTFQHDNTDEVVTNCATTPAFGPRRTIHAQTIIVDAPPKEWFEAIGKTNTAKWQDDEPRTWMLMEVEAETKDLGKTHSIRASWLYNPETWDTFAIHRDIHGRVHKRTATALKALLDGKVPKVDKVNGAGRYKQYETVDFDKVFEGLADA